MGYLRLHLVFDSHYVAGGSRPTLDYPSHMLGYVSSYVTGLDPPR